MNRLEESLILLAQNAENLQDEATPKVIGEINTKIIGILGTVETILYQVGGGLIILAIILSGFRYLTGDAKGGKSALIAAITGLAIILFAYFILNTLCLSLTEKGCYANTYPEIPAP